MLASPLAGQKAGRSYLLHINTVACRAEDQACFHRFGESLRLQRDLFLFFFGEVDKVVVFCANQERNGGLVEPTSLPIPFLDRVQGRFAGEVKHEEDGDGVVADQREHVDKLALSAEIPNGECDFCVSDGDCLFHEVDA